MSYYKKFFSHAVSFFAAAAILLTGCGDSAEEKPYDAAAAGSTEQSIQNVAMQDGISTQAEQVTAFSGETPEQTGGDSQFTINGTALSLTGAKTAMNGNAQSILFEGETDGVSALVIAASMNGFSSAEYSQSEFGSDTEVAVLLLDLVTGDLYSGSTATGGISDAYINIGGSVSLSCTLNTALGDMNFVLNSNISSVGLDEVQRDILYFDQLVADSRPASGGGQPFTCPSCKGSTKCHYCDGDGTCHCCFGCVDHCISCGGSNICQQCRGTTICKHCGGTGQMT